MENRKKKQYQTVEMMLPKDTREVWEALENIKFEKREENADRTDSGRPKFSKTIVSKLNLYLAHNSFLCREKKGNISLLTNELKYNKIKGDSFDGGKLIHLSKQLNKRTKILSQKFERSERYWFIPYDRVVVGLGGNSPYRNIQLFRLHFLYGIPYLPASMLKGSLRSCFLTEGAVPEDIIEKLFGKGGGEEDASSGSLVFFDSYPECFSLGFDVQAPHYSEYYGKGAEFTDCQSPNVLYFTCLYDAEFPIDIACNDGNVWEEWGDKITDMVKVLFTQYGLGGKKSLGYGVMDEWDMDKIVVRM